MTQAPEDTLRQVPVPWSLTSETARSSAVAELEGSDEEIAGALDALDALRVRPEPYEILGYCNLRGGAGSLAVRSMRAAVAREPQDWRYSYGLAVALALSGRDPRSEARRARDLNPHEPLAIELERDLTATKSRRRWFRVAAQAHIPPF